MNIVNYTENIIAAIVALTGIVKANSTEYCYNPKIIEEANKKISELIKLLETK